MGGIFSKLHLKVPLAPLQSHLIAISFTWIHGDHEMKHWWIVAEDLITSHRRLRAPKSRGPRRVELSCDPLEERATPSHLMPHLAAAVPVPRQVAHHSSLGNTTTPSPVTPTHGVGGSHSTNTALKTAIQTLRKDVQTIELASGTTVGQLTAIRVAFQKLASDGLKPSSYSALQSFENSLVTAKTSLPTGTTLASDTTLLNQFMALYTSSPTTQQTTDLTTAYNALAAAVTSAGVTSGNITTINTDWAAVLAALNSTSTATFPYFTLVTGQGAGVCNGLMAF